ncbi:MAG: hypothetical protein JST47_03250 [Bacteroidetes bacterium]|nr:hypothetical protein [Bacteroidota bacterium]MBS1974146.1 hypothetical protein [Bacteroidota bacterium]
MAKTIFALIVSVFGVLSLMAQPITGVWKGKAGNHKVELKIIKSGDSLTGTAYYYSSAGNYKRYSIKGYFDPKTNDVIWWDDALIGDKLQAQQSITHEALMNIADFNCPGEDELRLDGNTYLRDEKKKLSGTLNLQKTGSTNFPDEWDWVINNYTIGASDPDIIDSISKLSPAPHYVVLTKKSSHANSVTHRHEQQAPEVVLKGPLAKEEKKATPVHELTPEEKFASRKKILEQVIQVKGDSIELRFYDNGEIDGDSIAFFMNSRLIFKHIMISDQPYTVKFATKDLEEDNEAVMVAENLGAIPPNTSLMVAICGDRRYEAHLFADENSSALIRFVKEAKAAVPLK